MASASSWLLSLKRVSQGSRAGVSLQCSICYNFLRELLRIDLEHSYEPLHFTLSTTFWASGANLSNTSGGAANQIITVSPLTSSRTKTLRLLTSLKYAAAASLLRLRGAMFT